MDENNSYGNEVEKIIGEHIEKYEKKEENKYNGIISVIKISSKIDKANENCVEHQLQMKDEKEIKKKKSQKLY